jgi:hypothetical protein
MLRNVRMRTIKQRYDVEHRGVHNDAADNVTRNQEFEAQQDCSPDILTEETVRSLEVRPTMQEESSHREERADGYDEHAGSVEDDSREGVVFSGRSARAYAFIRHLHSVPIAPMEPALHPLREQHVRQQHPREQ